jgi:4-amino-4-deoxy-L-arabinose transferase-like glycosyltransferase
LDVRSANTLLTRWGIPVGLFLLALAVRLPALAQFLTPDEFLWVDRSRNFLAGLLNSTYVCESPTNHTGLEQAVGLACTLRTGHPGVTTMWTGSLGILLHYVADQAPCPLFDYVVSIQTNPLDPRFIAPVRLPTVVLTSLWVAVMYWLVWRLFGDRRVALVAGLLLALDPFHAAFSRVIHHDALSTTFMTLSLLMALIYWAQQASRGWLAASGVLAGVAFLSKSPSLFLMPFIALIGLWSLVSRRMRGDALTWRHVALTVGDGLLWFGSAAITFVAFWPAMWVIPIDTLRTVFFIGSKYATGGHAKGNYFLGTVSQDPGVLFYPVTWLLRSSPLVWVGLIASVIVLVKQRINKSTNQQNDKSPGGPFAVSPVSILLAFVILFVLFLTFGEKKQDRYILPVYPILGIVAAIGLVRISSPPRRSTRAGKSPVSNLQTLLFVVILFFQGLLVVFNYPYYLTYYNPLLGGIQVAERMVTVGWGEGLELAAEYLNQKPDAEDMRVSAWYQSTFAPFFKGEAISYSQEKGKAMAGDYVVFYINQLQRRFPDEELYHYFETRYQPDQIIPLKGVNYVVIYPGPRIQHYVEDRVDEQRRVYRGIAALLGWDWLGVANAERPVVAPGEALPFRLYWEYLGKVPEEEFFFRLVGPDEQVWAEGVSQPVLDENGDPATWRQGQIITEEGELPVPPGTPPGEYQLQIGFYTQAPAVTEGELIFDVPPDDDLVEVAASAQPVAAAQAIAVDDLPLSRRQDTQFAELRLLGTTSLETPLVSGEPWGVDVYWQAEATPETDFYAHLSLADDDGQSRWVWDAEPLVSFYPTSRWAAGEVVRSRIAVVPTPRTPGGEYDLRLTLLDEMGQTVGEATLGPVRVEGRVRSFDLPSVEIPVGATFGDAIELAGVDLQSPDVKLRPGDEVAVNLVWRALAPVDADYTVSVQLLGPDGQVYGQKDAVPAEGDAPTSTWSPGEVLSDPYRFTVASDAPPGEYQLIVAMYMTETGERLWVQGDGDAVTLGWLELTP